MSRSRASGRFRPDERPRSNRTTNEAQWNRHARVRRHPLPFLLRGYLRAQALLLLPQLGRELGAEVLRLEHLADLDLGILPHRIGAALDPFDRLLLRLYLPDPDAGDQLLGLGEGPVDY